MRIEIESVRNGYVIKSHGIGDDGEDIEEQTVIEEDTNSTTGEIKAFQSLCYELMDLFCINNRKHNSERLYIEIKKNNE